MSVALTCRVGDLSIEECTARLRGPGLGLRVGPFNVCLESEVRDLDEPLRRLYRDHPLLDPGAEVFSCHIALHDVWRLRPRPGRYVRFIVDGRVPHEDLPVGQALAVFEWGLNLVIALRSHRFLMLHAAVLERGGRALALPAAPGSGKTTLCAGLAERGWRLLSDEFGLLKPGTASFIPLPRPMPLKNESIGVMQAFAPGIELGPRIENTRKGTVAHVRASTASVLRQDEAARARWLVFPQWRPAVALSLIEMSPLDGFAQLVTNSFNYEVVGAAGFDLVREVVAGGRCFTLVYSDLGEAVAALTAMADDDAG